MRAMSVARPRPDSVRHASSPPARVPRLLLVLARMTARRTRCRSSIAVALALCSTFAVARPSSPALAQAGTGAYVPVATWRETATTLPPLLKVLRTDPEAEVRRAALVAAVRVGGGSTETLAGLRQALADDTDIKVRVLAAGRIAKWGPQAADATGELLAALQFDDSSLRAAAADALAAVGPAALPALLERTDHQQREVRLLAILAIGRMGPPAASAADRLRPLLKDDDPAVRSAAELTLRRITANP